ncbi:MAG: LysE family translocator [Paracoccaceae bacterium]
MPMTELTALITLAMATLYTPGPNNTMLAASGARFGLRPSLPHMLGVALGFPAMLLIVGLLLGELFQTSAMLREGLRWGGAALLLWMAWKMAISGGIGSKSEGPRPMTFLEAAAFQWINPKGWTMAVAASSQFITAARPVASAVVVAVVFAVLGLGSSLAWTAAGRAMTRWLTTDRRLQWFNMIMALLIVASVIQLLVE